MFVFGVNIVSLVVVLMVLLVVVVMMLLLLLLLLKCLSSIQVRNYFFNEKIRNS
jgi:hypothetical protein